jgi:hypothetical protein
MIQGYFQKDSQCKGAFFDKYKQPKTVSRKTRKPAQGHSSTPGTGSSTAKAPTGQN